MAAHFYYLGLGLFPTALGPSDLLAAIPMTTNSPQPKGRDRALSLLNAAIEVLNLAKEAASIIPAKNVFGLASALLVKIRVRLPLYKDNLLVHVYLGYDGQRRGLYQAWVILR